MLNFEGVSSERLWELPFDAQKSCLGGRRRYPVVDIETIVYEGLGITGDLLVVGNDVELLAQDVAAGFITEGAHHEHQLGEAVLI